MNKEKFLLKLYQLTRDTELTQFKPTIMTLLEELIPFSSAIWLEGIVQGGLFLSNSYLHNQPMAFMENYAQHCDMDFFSAEIEAYPGKVVNPDELVDSLNFREKWLSSDLYNKHCVPFGIKYALGVAFPIPSLGIYSIISIYRDTSYQAYTEHDKEIFQYIAPHLIEAYKNCTFICMGLRQNNNHSAEGIAFVDHAGLVHEANSHFSDLIQKNWPDWQGPKLPEVLNPSNLSNTAAIKNGAHYKISPISEDMFYLSAYSTQVELDLLTETELRIAKALAAGGSYKEIAKKSGISPSTVTNHSNSIYKKLNVKNKTELSNRYVF